MRIRGSIIRSRSLSPLKAIISTLTDAKVGSGQKPGNPARLTTPHPPKKKPNPCPAPTGGPGEPRRQHRPGEGEHGHPGLPSPKKASCPPPPPLPACFGAACPPKKTTRRPPTAPAPGASRQLCPPLPLLLGYLQMKLGSRPGPQRLPHPKSPPHQPASFPICSPAAPSAPQGSPDRVAGRLSRGSGRIGFRGGGRAHMLRDHRRGSPAPPAGPGAGSPPITLP